MFPKREGEVELMAEYHAEDPRWGHTPHPVISRELGLR